MYAPMSNVVYLSFPSTENVRASLDVVAALVRRGEHITYYATEPFRAEIEATGAVFAPYTNLPEGLLDEKHNSLALSLSIIKACNILLPTLIATMQETPPDYIIFDSMCVWGWYAAQALNIASISSMSRFMVDSSVLHDSGKQSAIFREIMRHLSTLREYREVADEIEQKYGVRTPNFTDILNNTGLMTLVYTLPQLQPNAAALGNSVKFVGPILPATNGAGFPLERLDSRPLIYISTREGILSEFYDLCVEAFADSDCQVVFYGSGGEAEIPANFTLTNHEPPVEVLCRAALHITPGSLHDVHRALACDVPLLLSPQNVEQSIMAEQMVSLGVGRQVELAALSGVRLQEDAAEILSNIGYKAAARELGTAIRTSRSAEQAADEVVMFKQAYAL
jgi:MGT family glycosyltransferase